MGEERVVSMVGEGSQEEGVGGGSQSGLLGASEQPLPWPPNDVARLRGSSSSGTDTQPRELSVHDSALLSNRVGRACWPR